VTCVVGSCVGRFLRGLALLMACALAAKVLQAEMLATPLRGDSRLVEFLYDADNSYLVLAKPKAVTHMQFAADELIQSVAAGDTSNWEFTPTRNRKNLFIKPRFDDQETSMTVLTDKRSYQFVLRSTGDGKKWYQRVSWVYGSELVLTVQGQSGDDVAASPSFASSASAPGATVTAARAPLAPEAAVEADKLRFGYEITGEAPFRPRIVFDDGRFTYFKMPAALQELPALFAVIEGKDYSLVNFDVKGDYLVAQRLLPLAVLKLGREEVRVSRPAPKRNLFGLPGEAP
jgi:type IV secretion system protein VirB9